LSRSILVRPSTISPISGAEELIDLGAGGIGVLDGVVQQRHRDRGVVQLQVGQDGRDFERVGEIRVAGGALLAAVLLHGIDIGLVEQRFVGLRVVGLDPLDELVLTHHWLAALLAAPTYRTVGQTKRRQAGPTPLKL
jgi:hypothetical protein